MIGPCPMPDGTTAELVPYDLGKHPFYGIAPRPFVRMYRPAERAAADAIVGVVRATGHSAERAASIARCYIDHTPTLRG